MAQTREFLPHAKQVYRRFFSVTSPVNRMLRAGIEAAVRLYARMRGFYFPEKYNWEWKLEMLLRKYEEDTVRVFRNIIKPGMTVVDIGAHIGFFTTLFAELVGPTGHVYAFEPDVQNFELLKKNTARFAQVSIYNKAVSDNTGTSFLYKMPGSTGCHSISQHREGDVTIPIETVSIDDFVQTENIGAIHIIKIDTEGAEPLAFAGMKRLVAQATHISIMTEFNPAALKNSGTEPLTFLKEKEAAGFSISQITKAGPVPVDLNRLNQESFYQGKNEYANMLLVK